MHGVNIAMRSISTGAVATTSKMFVGDIDEISFIAILVLVDHLEWPEMLLCIAANSSISPANAIAMEMERCMCAHIMPILSHTLISIL